MDTKWLVSADHKVEKYRLNAELVTVKMDRYDNRYYWSHHKYGCSKSYVSPQEAIIGMLQDHACFNIRYQVQDGL